MLLHCCTSKTKRKYKQFYTYKPVQRVSLSLSLSWRARHLCTERLSSSEGPVFTNMQPPNRPKPPNDCGIQIAFLSALSPCPKKLCFPSFPLTPMKYEALFSSLYIYIYPKSVRKLLVFTLHSLVYTYTDTKVDVSDMSQPIKTKTLLLLSMKRFTQVRTLLYFLDI